MRVTPVKTVKITPGSVGLFDLLDQFVDTITDKSILAVTSKVVSLCENNVIALSDTDKEKLVVNESDLYIPHSLSKYGHHFTITNNTLIPMAGVDESNGDGHYILWPKNAQKTANDIRQYLSKRFNIKQIGVVITDSTCQPLRRGTTGIALAHSGFLALHQYIGQPDLFGRPFGVTQANIAGGVAASAVLAMGEGAEQTPLCILEDLPFVNFQNRNPAPAELDEIRIPLEDDLFEPFLSRVKWRQGRRKENL